MFGLAIQIIDDFRNAPNITADQKINRNKILSSLRIDTTLRRADYAKFYQDIESSKADYLEVINICSEYL